MRLSVQSFQRKFDPQDPNIMQKVDEYSKTLIQQIDTMSSIASAFSNFAKMPAQQNEMLDVVEITKLALDIFNESFISFNCDEKEIIAKSVIYNSQGKIVGEGEGIFVKGPKKLMDLPGYHD